MLVNTEPGVAYFKPRGVPMAQLEESALTVNEYEALRLADLERLSQADCAKKMGVSQPTFNRTLASAHQKVADAIINGKAIKIGGGNYTVKPRS